MLKLRYIHLSAHWNHPLGKRDGGSLKVVYINAPRWMPCVRNTLTYLTGRFGNENVHRPAGCTAVD
ncbi:hypothetical protein EMIT0324P_11646 [Pseudomonas chlororaphis]